MSNPRSERDDLYEEIKLTFVEERERDYREFIDENPELFCPCFECLKAKECIAYFKTDVSEKSKYMQKKYFFDWITKCVSFSKVKSRQEILSLADEWTNRTRYTIDFMRGPSYRYTVGKCLNDLKADLESEIRFLQRSHINFYFSKDVPRTEVEKIVKEKVDLTQKKKSFGNQIGDCLVNIVAEYFQGILHEPDVKKNMPINLGEGDIDVLSKEYMIEVRNHDQPLDFGGLKRILKKMDKWSSHGYNRKKVLVCSKILGETVVKICNGKGIVLVVLGYQVLPEEVYKEFNIGIKDNIAIRWFIWNKMRKRLGHGAPLSLKEFADSTRI